MCPNVFIHFTKKNDGFVSFYESISFKSFLVSQINLIILNVRDKTTTQIVLWQRQKHIFRCVKIRQCSTLSFQLSSFLKITEQTRQKEQKLLEWFLWSSGHWKSRCFLIPLFTEISGLEIWIRRENLLCVMVHAYDTSTQEVGAGLEQLKCSLAYISRSYLKNQNESVKQIRK